MLIVALTAGLLVGLTMGALGGGGSILTVPVLVYLLGLPASDATTASLVIVGLTSVAAALGHLRAGRARWRLGGGLAAAGVPAALAGTALNRRVDPDVLLLAFAGVMVVAAVGMLARSRSPGTEDEADQRDRGSPPRWRGAVRLAAAGLAIGGLTGFLGVGGGFVVVPVLVLAFGLPMVPAVGTSLLVLALNSAVALGARATDLPALAWSVVGPFTAVAVVGALAGRGVAERTEPRVLTAGFAVLLLAVAGYVGVRAGTGLA